MASPFPIAELLGFEVVARADGTATVVFEAQERHENTRGSLHGGVLCDIADAAMGNAYRTGLAPGESHATVELKINFLRPVRRERVTAIGRVIWRGGRLGYVECDIRNAHGETVARASSTCITLRPRAAAGATTAPGAAES